MICGQNLNMKGIQDQVSKMKSDLLSTMDLDASGLKSQLTSEIGSLVSDIRGMIPAMPSTANVNLQTELSSLMSLAPSSSAYTAKHAELLGQFGSAVTGKGISFDSIISGLSGGSLDVCGGVPNFELPTGAAVAIEKAAGSLKPEVESLKEELSTIVRNPGMVSSKTAMETLSSAWGGIPSPESTVYEVSEKVTTLPNDFGLEIKKALSTDMITQVSKSTTPVFTVPSLKAAAGKLISATGTTERVRSNYNKEGVAARPKGKLQKFRENFDQMELGKKPVLTITAVHAYFKSFDHLMRAKILVKKIVYETEVDPEVAKWQAWWSWVASKNEGGAAIKINNLSNIVRVHVRYKYPSTSDPRWAKKALQKESV